MILLSVAIPTMNRWSFLKESLPLYLKRPDVGEVIICDETGDDVNAILRSPLRSNPKLRLFINDSVIGIYRNKVKCMNLARYKWIALLDSDNYFMDDWFDRLQQVIGKNPMQIYSSASFISNNLDTGERQTPATSFIDTRISKRNWNAVINRPNWLTILNNGNWVFSKEASEIVNPMIHSNAVCAADAIYILRQLIQGGCEIWYVPELNYIYTVHSESSWRLTEKQSTRILNTTSWYIS
jgi:glycosyltransferase involved in cell wall biosynthesis